MFFCPNFFDKRAQEQKRLIVCPQKGYAPLTGELSRSD